MRDTLFFAVCCLLLASAAAQPVGDSDLEKGRQLLARLSPNASDAAADRAVFQQAGIEYAQKVLLAVGAQGLSADATAEDWKAMHRAYDALVELYTGEQQLFKAAAFAQVQQFAYDNCERDYASGLAAARQELDLQQRSGMFQTISIPWQNIGAELMRLGRLDEAADAYQQARKFQQVATSPLAADAWTKIIAIESSRGNTAQAQREAEDFLNAAGPAAPPSFRASAQLAAANLDVDEQHYDSAITRVHDALRMVKGLKDATTTGYQALNVLLTLGLKAMENMPYDEAMSLCERLDQDFPALPIHIEWFAREVANHRRRLAGQFDLVLRDDASRLETASKNHDADGEVYSLLSTAVDYAYMRETTQQVTALQSAASILHSPRGATVVPDLRYRVLERLGDAELDRGDLRAARAAYTEVLNGIDAITSGQTKSQLGGIYAEAKLGIASVLEKDGDLKAARQILDQALNPPPGSPGQFTRSDVLLQRARLEESAHTGKPGEPQPDTVAHNYFEAIAELHKAGDANTEVYARLKLIHYLATDGAAASAHLNPNSPAAVMAREQLALARTAANSVGLADAQWRVHFLEGLLEESEGHRDAAIRAYAEAVSALDRIRTGLSAEDERKSFIDSDAVQELYRRQIQLLTGKGDRAQAWDYLERDKARSFLESLRGKHFAPAPNGTTITPAAADLQQIEQKILAARLSLSAEGEMTLRQSGRSPEAVHTQLIALENQYALARQQSMLSTSRATQPMSLEPISLAATQARLPARTALIEYAVLDGELAAFVVTHSSAVQVHWPGDTQHMAAKMQRLSSDLASSTADAGRLHSELSAASDLLLVPLLGKIPAGTDRLVIIPTQSLSLIPFQALPLPGHSGGNTGPGALLLIDRYSVDYLPSASTLQFLRFGPPSASKDLFLGAIGDVSSENLPPLPGTLTETAEIAKLYPAAVRVTGPQFTHQVALDALAQHEEVHFATHGLFEEKAPLFSALVTAPAEGQPSRLSLYELTGLHVKARLVILSACETDRGQMTRGDEGAGLTRTFLQAGAENVVSSLWKVSDEATAMLMESLHKHLRRGEIVPEALRHAELEVRGKYPQPFYWAAFVDTGVR